MVKVGVGIGLLLLVAVMFFAQDFQRILFRPNQEFNEQVQSEGTYVSEVDVVASGLNIPWEVEVLEDEKYIVTERPGNLVYIQNIDGFITKELISGVEHKGEGGLLGMALHPNFDENKWLYLYMTTSEDGGLTNRVVRYLFNEGGVTEDKEIIVGIPGAQYHDGGRIEFGPDGYLYITTGDAGRPDDAQNSNVLNGKILRVSDDGEVPDSNPYGNEIFSLGHRNPQGIAWDVDGRLWSTEHGRSGLRSGLDELNLIDLGGNYGWPEIQGDEVGKDMIAPIRHSGSITWAPAGIDYFDGKLYFAGLRGESLYMYDLETTELEVLLQGYGRLRAVKVHDGYLYITTSNQDGRGVVQEGDDKLLRVSL